jgi:hypothetical protein
MQSTHFRICADSVLLQCAAHQKAYGSTHELGRRASSVYDPANLPHVEPQAMLFRIPLFAVFCERIQ